MLVIGDNEHLQDYIRQHNVAVIYFGSPHCAACQRIQPDAEKLAKEINLAHVDLNVTKVNGITKIPNFSFFKNGKYQGDLTAPSINEIKQEYNNLLGTATAGVGNRGFSTVR